MQSEVINDFFKEPDESVKLYSGKAIGLGVFFGGFVAAGVLMRRNYLALGKPRAGLNALMLGIISTLILFSLLVVIPERVLDKIPNSLIPLIYTLLFLGVFEVTQGASVRKHQQAQGSFYKMSRALLTGLFWMVINIGLVFGTVYLSDSINTFDQEMYSQKMEQYIANEEEALKVFNVPETASQQELAEEMKTGMKLYQKNGEIIQEIYQMKGIPQELEEIVHMLEKYNNLRISHFELLYKAISEDTDQYDVRIGRILNEIQELQKNAL